ncbi:MAG: helix-turn-helix transcriptional regulator [Clostridia bacterium]|nr:helix-turn-helix transcriptional regulator [Clostridia bacterium]
MTYDIPKFTVRRAVEISSITSIHYFEFDDSFVDTPESHEPWELVYVDRGACEILAGEETLPLSQGEMYFHKPYERHMLKTVRGIAPNIFIIVFSSDSPAMQYFEGKKLAASMTAKQHIAAIIHEASSTFELPFNDPRMAELKLKETGALWAGEQSVLLRLELMLIEIIRDNRYYSESPKRFYPKDIVSDDFALSVIRLMEERIYGQLTMDDLSRELSFGKTYISRKFRRACGSSVIDYYNMMKINEAKRLVREGRYNFFEISERLMFSNSHYFSTLFKKHTGMTPTQYKRSIKND